MAATVLSAPRVEPTTPADRAPRRPAPERLVSLDVMRGVTVAAMVIVNNPAVGAPYVYRQMAHAPWDGWTFADTIFPAFLFMVGASLALGRPPRWGRTARRVVVLLTLGLVVNAAPLVLAHGLHPIVLAELRLPGVLQRIALADVLAVVVISCVPTRCNPRSGSRCSRPAGRC